VYKTSEPLGASVTDRKVHRVYLSLTSALAAISDIEGSTPTRLIV
jgi:hypothetical protein